MTTVEKPKIIEHNKVKYYNATDLKKYDPNYFYGTSGGIRKIIARKKIDSSKYHYATLSKKFGWTSCYHQNKPSTKAKLLLIEEWVVANVPKMMPDSDASKKEKYEYPEAPKILYLEDAEKFKDDNCNIVEIETRGERTPKGIYFLATDVSNVFEMPNLNKTLIDKDKGYKLNKHYKTFTHGALPTRESPPNKHHKTFNHGRLTITEYPPSKPIYKRQLFITYRGMLKILFSSRSGNADKFVEWATETLFTIQMGTVEQKEVLCSKLIGQPVKNIRAVFNTCSKKIPCIYRFSLGNAKTLRHSMNLPEDIKDDYVIIKYGLTNDLDRRSAEHAREYEKIKGVKLGLIDFSYIDPQFLQQAETDIKDYFSTYENFVKYNNYTELVAINPLHEKLIKKQFNLIGTAYQGHITELVIQIEKLKNIIKLKDKDLENKDLIIEKKDIEIENEKLRNELLELKLQNQIKINLKNNL